MMKKSIEKAIKEGLQDLVNIGVKPKGITKQDLKGLGVMIPKKPQ